LNSAANPGGGLTVAASDEDESAPAASWEQAATRTKAGHHRPQWKVVISFMPVLSGFSGLQ